MVHDSWLMVHDNTGSWFKVNDSGLKATYGLGFMIIDVLKPIFKLNPR